MSTWREDRIDRLECLKMSYEMDLIDAQNRKEQAEMDIPVLTYYIEQCDKELSVLLKEVDNE